MDPRLLARLSNLATIFRRTAHPSSEESTIGSPYPPVGAPPPSVKASVPINHLHARLGQFRLERPRLPSWERPLVTMSVEGSELRIATVLRGSIDAWLSAPLGGSGALGGQITNPTALGAKIDEICGRFALPRSRVAWAIPGHQMATQIIDLPDLHGEELRRAITEEAERFLGIGAAESFLYWQRLEGRIRRRSVFLLAVPKTTVLSALEALDAAGIRPWTMDARPLAIARAVGRSNAIVIGLEETSLDLVIVDRGTPRFLRSLPLPASSDLEGAQNRLLEETERCLSYYGDIHPSHPLDPEIPIFLTGSLATGITLAERLRAVTHHPIGRLASSLSHPPDFPVSDFAVNLGLALKQG